MPAPAGQGHGDVVLVGLPNRGDGSLGLLSTDTQTFAFLYDNGIRGPVDNLLCSFDDLGIRRGYAPLAVAESMAALEPPPATVELEAMRRTLSWRLTAPLRAAQPVLAPVLRRLGRLRRR